MLSRLVASTSGFPGPAPPVAAAAAGVAGVPGSRRMGGAAGRGCWPGCGSGCRSGERLQIGTAILKVAAGRRLDGEATERVVFALVAQRALEPGPELAAMRGVAERVFPGGAPGFSGDVAYAAMDVLLRRAR